MLNRAIALAKVNGPRQAIEEIKEIKDNPSLKSYYLLYSTLAEFYMQLECYTEAAAYLETAIELSPLKVEKELLGKKLDGCKQKILKA
jgi:predicted RNA polymerase sigma factor